MEKHKPTTIVLVRHGQAEQNVMNSIAAHSDTPLTAKGLEQAARRGITFKNAGYIFDAAYSSYLKRANQTVKKILQELGQSDVPVMQINGLEERYMGDVAEKGYLPRDKFDEYVLRRINRQRINTMTEDELRNLCLVEGWETDNEVMRRGIGALKKIAKQHPEQTILVGSHSNQIRTDLVGLGLAKRENLPSGSLHNAGYIVLETYDGGQTFVAKESEGLFFTNSNPNKDQADNYLGFSMRRTR